MSLVATRLGCISLGIALGIAAVPTFAQAQGSKLTPVEQNAVIHKYCGSCHSDKLMYGGLSVEHFDAAVPDPTVAIMLFAKLTAGLSPKQVEAWDQDPNVAAMVADKMSRGAMGAGGIGVPDRATQDALTRTLAAQAVTAGQWNSRWSESPPPHTFTVSMVTEVPSTRPGVTDMFRVILTCHTNTHVGEIKIAWANSAPEEGRMVSIAVDGKAPFSHKVDGGEKQGNGKYGPGATILTDKLGTSLPGRSLTISNLFAQETAVFPFDQLSSNDRRSLSACFADVSPTY